MYRTVCPPTTKMRQSLIFMPKLFLTLKLGGAKRDLEGRHDPWINTGFRGLPGSSAMASNLQAPIAND